jgi:AraC-like DNA-binding protein
MYFSDHEDKENKIINLARDYLDLNYRENTTLKQLVQMCGLDMFHLVRLFHQKVGMPPHAYLNQVRVERAKKMLKSGNYTIGQVAAETGFVDQSHLTRQFKRIVGMTPGQYLQNCKNVQDIETERC